MHTQTQVLTGFASDDKGLRGQYIMRHYTICCVEVGLSAVAGPFLLPNSDVCFKAARLVRLLLSAVSMSESLFKDLEVCLPHQASEGPPLTLFPQAAAGGGGLKVTASFV